MVKIETIEQLIIELSRPGRDEDKLAPIASLEAVKEDPVYNGIYEAMKDNAYWAEFSSTFFKFFGISPSKLVPEFSKVEELTDDGRLLVINKLRSEVYKLIKTTRNKTKHLREKNEDKFKLWCLEQSKLPDDKQSPLYKTLLKKNLS